MKKRLHDKKAGIAILIALIIISLADIIFRAAAMGEAVLTTSNLGEQLVVIALALTILTLTAKGKDRVCYILYGAWIGYFVLDQLFELPGMLGNLLSNISHPSATISIVIRMLTMVCIVVIGALLVEYITDGTIYNRAFNTFCFITILLLVVSILTSASRLIFSPHKGNEIVLYQQHNVLVIFNYMYNITMVFLFTFFAYDSAKMQLKKTDLTK